MWHPNACLAHTWATSGPDWGWAWLPQLSRCCTLNSPGVLWHLEQSCPIQPFRATSCPQVRGKIRQCYPTVDCKRGWNMNVSFKWVFLLPTNEGSQSVADSCLTFITQTALLSLLSYFQSWNTTLISTGSLLAHLSSGFFSVPVGAPSPHLVLSQSLVC